ncbi:NOP protein chaperone 1 [Etheostoma spectabile]|uniref:Uncharacterized protein n=1 Tax=Etheostoma spectabile TaxID=54343 RepID=A0A5J5CA07_9PERO|nr:uncharacterized protein C12orf45 homolog [Etheostoma spectabile]KAA8578055.1 hypothetical protein FQN60_018711 [Etheostoma spectabile]
MSTQTSPLKMDLNAKKTSSKALLSCGNGGGLSEKLLLKPKTGRPPQTERVPRSSVLERLQTFLPQMATANEKLRLQMADAPAGRFDIESVDEAEERVIEMDVALVELSGSDSDSADGDETSSEEEDEEEEEEEEESESITEQNLKLPGDKGKRKTACIQVLHPPGE